MPTRAVPCNGSTRVTACGGINGTGESVTCFRDGLRVKGEKWKAFCDRHGDWGRDLALWYGRRYAGLQLWELGERAGGLDYSATSEAIRYFERVKMKRSEIQHAHRRVAQFLNLEM